MSSFSTSEVPAFPAHAAIVKRIATDVTALSAEALSHRRVEGVGVWSFLAMVALVSSLAMMIAALTTPTPWGVAALSINWERNDELLFAIDSDPSEVRISSLAEMEQPGSSALSKKIAAKAGSLDGAAVAEWFDSIGAPDAAQTVRASVAQAKRKGVVAGALVAVMILLSPLVTAYIATKVIDLPADMASLDLAAPLTLWVGFWALVTLPFTLGATLLATSGMMASLCFWAQLLVVFGKGWQLNSILGGVAQADLKQSLIVYIVSSLALWLAGVGLMLAFAPLIG